MHTATKKSEGFMIGLLLGAVLTAIFTPKNGEEMRGIIQDKASAIKRTTEDAAGNVKDMATENIDRVKQVAKRSKKNFEEEADQPDSTTIM